LRLDVELRDTPTVARTSEIRKFRIGAFALGFMVALAIVASPPASAGTPAFCQQYSNSPECRGDVGPAGGSGNETPDNAGNGPTADSDGSDSGGSLPFTGYPLTPLLLLFVALLAAGLALRTATALRNRHRARPARSP
jgi:hypothetical protein